MKATSCFENRRDNIPSLLNRRLAQTGVVAPTPTAWSGQGRAGRTATGGDRQAAGNPCTARAQADGGRSAESP